MVWSCAATVNASARAMSAATPEALSPAPCVASGAMSRLATSMMVPWVRPLATP